MSVLALLAERLRPRGGGPQLVRLSSCTLTTQASVHAVRWHDQELLLGCTPAGVTVLSRRAAQEPAP